MMELSRKGEYAIKGILFLAAVHRDRICILSEIADEVKVPQTSLAKIFQQFTKAGLVKSFRGTHGGFALGRPARSITLREVIESVECGVTVNHCVVGSETCGRTDSCGMHPVWADVQQKVSSMLERVTLEDLLVQ